MRTPSPTTLYVGKRVAEARAQKGISQLKLAHDIGRIGDDAGAHISRIESGVQEPKLETLIRIAEALEVPLESLLPI